MASPPIQDVLQSIVDKTVDQRLIFGSVLSVFDATHNVECTVGAGNLSIDTQYFIASTTKLFTSACIMQLRQENKLQLTDPIARYIPKELLSGLHDKLGIDCANRITVQHLLAQTSGLPDYFLGKNRGEESLEEKIVQNKDQAWSFEQAIALSNTLKPKFEPGKPGKAHYSDTNYQLLGRIIELLDERPIAEVYQQRVVAPLQLTETYLYADPEDTRPANIYFKQQQLHIPKAMSSFGADGGIVSTASDMMVFLKAFMSGQLFPKQYFQEMLVWNRIFFPLQYGVGIARFKLPRLFSPFAPLPEFIGHSGLSGAFAFCVPGQQVYLTGTVNQIHKPGTSFRLMLKAVQAMKRQ